MRRVRLRVDRGVLLLGALGRQREAPEVLDRDLAGGVEEEALAAGAVQAGRRPHRIPRDLDLGGERHARDVAAARVAARAAASAAQCGDHRDGAADPEEERGPGRDGADEDRPASIPPRLVLRRRIRGRPGRGIRGVDGFPVSRRPRQDEQLGLVAAQAEHRRHPLERVPAEAEDRDAAADDRLVDAAAVRERGVEALRERDGRRVADRELHRGDGVDAAVDERGGRAGVQLVRARGARHAGVDHDQPGSRLGLVEQVGERRRVHVLRPPVWPDECEHSLVGRGIVRPVPDEVQHVPRRREQLLVHVGPGDVVEPLDEDPASGDVRPERRLEAHPFGRGVDRRQVAGRRDHRQHAQRRVEAQRLHHVRRRDLADERLLAADVHAGLGVVQRLPWEGRERRRDESEPHLQALPALLGDRAARAVRLLDVAGEDGGEQLGAHPLDLGLALGQDPPCGYRRGEHGGVHERQPGDEGVDVQPERRGCRVRPSRSKDADFPRARLLAGSDLQLDDRAHQRLPAVPGIPGPEPIRKQATPARPQRSSGQARVDGRDHPADLRRIPDKHPRNPRPPSSVGLTLDR